MKRVTIKLSDIEAVKAFNCIVQKFDVDMDLLSGRYTIDAKSIMGILSLDLNEPIQMLIHADDIDEIQTAIKEFLV